MPRPGPACLTCREKCRKCDRERPFCQRCISKGLVCGGYPEQFRFCGIASRGKWRGARAPVRGAHSRSESSRTEDDRQSFSSPGTSADDTRSRPNPHGQALADQHSGDDPPSPDGRDEISRIIGLPQTKMLLDHYESFICPHQISEIGYTDRNPYRTYILPLARKQIGLLYAVLGLSAAHLGRLKEDRTLYEDTAIDYRVRAIQALGEEIRKSQSASLLDEEQDAVLAIIQVLLLHDMCESGVSSHGIHITGAMSICKRLLISGGLNGERQQAVFFLGNLAWLDIIRGFAGAERLCFSQDIREMVACASGEHLFEMVNGCPREIFLIIGGVLDKTKEHTLGWLSWDEYHIALLLAKHKLYSWDRRARTYPSADARWLSVAESFQQACILRILRLLDPVRPANSPDIQECVNRILDAISEIPADCPLLELLVLPLFMAGTDCLSPHSRYYILSRLREIERRSEVRNPVPFDLLQKVWDARAAQDPNDDQNISWISFTHWPGLARQHDYLII